VSAQADVAEMRLFLQEIKAFVMIWSCQRRSSFHDQLFRHAEQTFKN